MRELWLVRPAYQVRGARNEELPDGHRIVRSVVAIGQVLDVPVDLVDRAEAAVMRVENLLADDRAFDPDEVDALAVLVTAVDGALRDGIGEDGRPRGAIGDRIRAEASRPDTEADGTLDLDRVFGISPDGRVGAAYPRTSLDQLLDELPVAARFLQQAAADRATVALVE